MRLLYLQAARLAVLLILAAAAGSAASVADEPALTPLSAAEFRELLAARRGQVLLVNFWATWCAPCLKEIPALQALEQRLAGRGFRLLAVSLDTADSIESVVRPFTRKWFPDFHSYASLEADMDSMVSVVDPAWNEILPTSYVLDAHGQVVTRLQGGKTGDEFAAVIEPLLD